MNQSKSNAAFNKLHESLSKNASRESNAVYVGEVNIPQSKFFPELTLEPFGVLSKDQFNELLRPCSYQEEIIQKVSNELSMKREAIILERIKRICPDFDIEEEKKRKFKRLVIIQHDNRDEFFFNDGSEDGVLIATFFHLDHNFDFDPKEGFQKMTWTVNYL